MQSRSFVYACWILLMTSAAWGQWVVRPTGSTENLYGVSARGLQGATVVGANATILYTEDDGFDWGPQEGEPGVDYNAVSFPDHSMGLIAGTSGTILVTGNAGDDWFTIETGWMHPYFAAHQLTPEVGAVAGINSVFQPIVVTTNDGWELHDTYVFYPVHGGSNQEGTIRGLYFRDMMTGFAAIAIFDGHGAICKTETGGGSWETVYWGDNALYAIDFANADTGSAVGANGAIVHTWDGGENWNDRDSPTNETLNGVSYGSARHVWAVGMGGTIVHSAMAGETEWETQDSPVGVDLYAVSMLNADTGYVAGDNGVVLYTANGGGASANQPPGEFWREMPVDGQYLHMSQVPVNLSWTASVDPDEDPIVYLLRVWISDTTLWHDTTFTTTLLNRSINFPMPSLDSLIYDVYWTVQATDGEDSVFAANGQGHFFVWMDVGADNQPSLPREFSLSAYPNPFNPTTTLSLSLPVSSEAVLRVFDVTGRLVTETRLGRLEGGSHEIAFDGSALPSGVYLATFETPTARVTQKLVLLK